LPTIEQFLDFGFWIFYNTCFWVPHLQGLCPTVPIILVATKIDLRDDPETIQRLEAKCLSVVPYQNGTELAKQIGALKYLECSALTGHGIKSVFDEVICPTNKSKHHCMVQ
jgi:Ras-related C3 botulinum toxin substrate 1